jgi:hypothetical protein
VSHKSIALFAGLVLLVLMGGILTIAVLDTEQTARESEVAYPDSITLDQANELIALIQEYRAPSCTDVYCAYIINSTTQAYHSSNPERAIAAPVQVVLFVDPQDTRFRHLAIKSVIEDSERGVLAYIVLIDFLGDGVIDVYIEEGVSSDLTAKEFTTNAGVLQAGSFIDSCLRGERDMCKVRLAQGRLMQKDLYSSFASGFATALKKARK